MSTTALIIEILVSGLFALCWFALFILKLYGFNLVEDFDSLKTLKDYSSLIIFLAFPVSYQLGWIMNYLSYSIVGLLVTNKIRRRIFGEYVNDYTKIKSLAFQNASTDFIKRLKDLHGVVRLSRAAVVNFVLISVGFLIHLNILMAIVALIIAVICLLQVRVEYKLYYEMLFYFFSKNDHKFQYKVVNITIGQRYQFSPPAT